MTLQQLRYIVSVANSGSISKSAEALFMSQPNLSNTIKGVESELGVRLFSRTNRGVQLTQDGEEFVSYARSVLTEMDKLELQYSSRKSGSLHLTVSAARSSAAAMAMAAYLGGLKSDYAVNFKETNAFGALEDVSTDFADLAIVKYSRDQEDFFRKVAEGKNLIFEPFAESSCCLLLSEDHPLTGKTRIFSSDLTQYPEIVHADFKEPITQKTFSLHPAESPCTKTVYVFDRGTAMLMLAHLPGSYLWTTATAPEVLSAYHLVECICEDNAPTLFEALIYPKDSVIIQSFRNVLLKRYAKQDIES